MEAVMEHQSLLFADGKVPRAAFFHDPPTLTTKTMAKVKAFPEVNKTYLICKLGTLDKSPLLKSPQYVAPDLAEAVLFGVNYAVYLVDLDKFRQGKRRKLFLHLQGCICDPSSCHQKNILSAYALACQLPFTISPHQLIAWGPHSPSERPKTVLLETWEDANDPQVNLFLAMMGCSNVQAADPLLLECLHQSKSRDFFPKRFSPVMYDYARGIVCGYCNDTNGELKKCPCGKAYYCSRECQHAHWREHKKNHKAAMKQSK